VSLEVPLETVAAAVEAGYRRKIPVILNPAPARALPPDLLAKVFLLTPNEGEARLLLANAGTAALAPVADTEPGEDDAAKGEAASVETNGVAALAAGLLASGVGAVVITLGRPARSWQRPTASSTRPVFPCGPWTRSRPAIVLPARLPWRSRRAARCATPSNSPTRRPPCR
jgi:sugar/nucleoside kinase (ribokinase family)